MGSRGGLTIATIAVAVTMVLGCATSEPATGVGSGAAASEAGARPESAEQEPVDPIVEAVPGLQISEWYQRPASTPRGTGHVYVVEFWATWCSPCRATIPELNALHRLYGDLMTLVAVTDQEPSAVLPFMEERGRGMEFAVARDSAAKDSWAAFMDAYGEGGIPHAFIVSDGEVRWHGHSAYLPRELRNHLDPSEMDRRLSERPTGAIDGSFAHAGTPLAELGVESLEVSLLDTLNRGAGWQSASYDPEESRFAASSMPMGSYYVRADGRDASGRRYYTSETVFAEPGSDLAVPVREVVVVEPPAGGVRDGEALEIPASTKELRWSETRATARYYVRIARTQDNAYTPIYSGWASGTSLPLEGEAALESGATYHLNITGYSDSGDYLSELYVDHPRGYVQGGLTVRVR